jgi:hypothetical protein
MSAVCHELLFDFGSSVAYSATAHSWGLPVYNTVYCDKHDLRRMGSRDPTWFEFKVLPSRAAPESVSCICRSDL